MVDTLHLLPPSYGPKSDPLLFGVTEALETLFPIHEIERSRLSPHAEASRLDDVEETDAA